jgi:hypothetical protein
MLIGEKKIRKKTVHAEEHREKITEGRREKTCAIVHNFVEG